MTQASKQVEAGRFIWKFGIFAILGVVGYLMEIHWIVIVGGLVVLFYFFRSPSNSNPNTDRGSGNGSKIIEEDIDYDIYPYYTEPEKSNNRSKGKWINPQKEISVGGKTISRGMFYFGGVLKNDYEQTENSLVDNSLSIKNAQYTFTDYSLSYWPSFRTLSPQCRGAYIDWLASDRDMVDVPIGYLFIYFYGLERRIIKDYKEGLVSDRKCAEICKEVLRLRSIFKHNRSFNGYSSCLLDYVSVMYPNIFNLPDEGTEYSIHSNAFKLKLACVVKNNEPLNSELAHAWIKGHPDYTLRTPARRCPEEFRSLFMQRYKEMYQEGMIIKPNKTPLRLYYRPASGSIGAFEFGPSGLCDPTVLITPTKKLAAIATQCTDELDAYSRYLGKKNTLKEDINAIALLPKEVIDDFEITLVKDFQSWVENVADNEDGMCDFKDLWAQTKQTLPAKVNKKDLELICNLIEKSGCSLAPHPELHGSKPDLDAPVVIYKTDSKVRVKNSTLFNRITIKLRLGSMVANADLKIHTNEVSFLQNIIHSDDKLTSQEKLSLEAYLKWLLSARPNFSGLKSSLGKLRGKDKEVVRKMLINVALSDGEINPNEIKEIEKLYTTLGLDKSMVPADIHDLSSRRKVPADKGTNVSPVSKEKQSFELDDAVLGIHETETKAAQNILNKIFKDEDESEDEESLETPAESTLENKALLIYKIISNEEKVKRTEFERICSEHGFFVDAAIDSINEWSFNSVGAPVIEDDVDIIIDREIAIELKELEEIR